MTAKQEMKGQNAQSGEPWWTRLPKRSLIVLAFIVAIGAIFRDTIERVSRPMTDRLLGAELIVSLSDLMLYSTDDSDYPLLTMTLNFENTFSEDLTLWLDHLEVVSGTRCDILTTEDPIEITAHGARAISLTSPCGNLRKVLSVPVKPDSCSVSLFYRVVGKTGLKTVSYANNDIVKCTYWQTPVYESMEHLPKSGVLAVIVPSLWETSQQGIADTAGGTVISRRFYISEDNKELINIQHLANIFKSPFAPIEFGDVGDFRKKFGGVYVGFLPADTIGLVRIYPYQLLTRFKGQERERLLGVSIPFNFENVRDFIYFTFDVRKDNPKFVQFQEHSKYCVIVQSEAFEKSTQVIEALVDAGYRVLGLRGKVQNRLFDLTQGLVRDDALRGLEQSINANLDSINGVIRSKGILMLWPQGVYSTAPDTIMSYVKGAVETKNIYIFKHDCRPFIGQIPQAPFAEVAVLFMDFSRESARAGLGGPVRLGPNARMFYTYDLFEDTLLN